MTITYLGRGQTRSGTNSQGTRSYVHTLLFSTTVSTENEYHVGSHASVPIIGTPHPDDAFAWVTSLEVENTEPIHGWTVTVNYSSERELATDPTNDPAIITWDGEQFQKPAIFAYDGTGICNSAGDPFDPPNMMDDCRPMVTVQKNVASVPVWVRTYQDAVNSDSFTVDGITVGAGLAKMQRVSIGEKQRRNGVEFRTVTFQITLRKEGWLLEPLDAGFREIQTGERINIKNDGDDEATTAPVPLDGAGQHIVNPTLASSVFLSYVIYEELAFSALPLT